MWVKTHDQSLSLPMAIATPEGIYTVVPASLFSYVEDHVS